MGQFLKDLRYGLRILTRNPGAEEETGDEREEERAGEHPAVRPGHGRDRQLGGRQEGEEASLPSTSSSWGL